MTDSCRLCGGALALPIETASLRCETCRTRKAPDKYKIIRGFRDSRRRITIARNLSLEEAQAHCRDLQTSSSTCTSATGRARTRKLGPWFDGYERD